MECTAGRDDGRKVFGQLKHPMPLETAGDTTLRRAISSRSAGPAKAGTHGKYMQNLCFLLPWIPTFAGMTVWNLCLSSFHPLGEKTISGSTSFCWTLAHLRQFQPPDLG
jgi:hypothetical protein